MKNKKRRYRKLNKIENERFVPNDEPEEMSRLARYIEKKIKQSTKKEKYIDLRFMNLKGYDLDLGEIKVENFYADNIVAEESIVNESQKSERILNDNQEATITISNKDQRAKFIFNQSQEAETCIENDHQRAIFIHNSHQNVKILIKNTDQNSKDRILNMNQVANKIQN